MSTFGNVVIFGDSYSTYSNYIPEGYAAYYSDEKRKDHAYVNGVEKTWWKMLINETDSNLLINNSWSGSAICYQSYDGIFPRQSFVRRAVECLVDGCYNSQKVDTVFIFGGTNDNWAGTSLGNQKYSDWTEKDLEVFLPAFCKLLVYLKNSSKDIRVINIMNTELKEEMQKSIIEVCKKLNIENVILHDIEKEFGHPTEKGMEQIKNQILEFCK